MEIMLEIRLLPTDGQRDAAIAPVVAEISGNGGIHPVVAEVHGGHFGQRQYC
jgi:hypothetical protein